VGNRALGTRLASEAGPEAERAATLVMLFLPTVPLLFMGQEWGASSPFLFFTDHEPQLGRLVSEGRRKEFARFDAFASPTDASLIPDPQAVSTFERSRLCWSDLERPGPRATLERVREMLALRRDDPVLRVHAPSNHLQARAEGDLLYVRRQSTVGTRTLVANLGKQAADLGHAGVPILSGGEVASSRLGPFAVAVWAGSAPAWPNSPA
jgi:maltooligosyltrehalose trehalohydrolase